jgi:hypothetical protein
MHTYQDLTTEIVEMKKRVKDAEKTINENAYHILLKRWATFVAVTLTIALVTAGIGIIIALQYPQTIPSGLLSQIKIESIVGTILGPSVTTIGLVIGFTPVISFFFVNGMKDDRREFKRMKKSFLKTLSENKLFETHENTSLVEMHYAYLEIIVHNRISGILKYVGTFIIVSLISLPLLIEAEVVLNSTIFLLLDLLSIVIIVEGIIPIIGISTYRPAIRITEHLVSGTAPNTLAIQQTLEPEDKIKTDKETAKIIKILKQAAEERKDSGEKEAIEEDEKTKQTQKTVSANR